MIKLPPRSARGVLTLPKSRQLSISFESICLQGMTPAKRAKASAHLANLLILAVGGADQERADDQR